MTDRTVTTRSPRSPRWDFMGRYRVRIGGRLFLDRLRIIQTPWFAVLLTRIHEPDLDRDPHNHSRAFATLILSGGYHERYWPDPRELGASYMRYHRRFSLMILPQAFAHRITQVNGPLRTLLLAGRHHGTFHFWTPGGPVDWKEYPS